MTVRIKRHWYREGAERGPQEMASVIAVSIWKASTHALKSIREAKFSVDVGAPFLAVLTEFLVFLVAVADRIAYRHDRGEWRQAFTVAVATRLAGIYQENLDELVGPDPGAAYKRRFIDLLNARMAEYAEFDYDEAGPDFGFLRYFGSCVEAAMTDADDRRWVLDPIMSVQAPVAVEVVERGMRGVLGIDPKPGRRSAAGG